MRVGRRGVHTDIHAAHGDWPIKPTPPFVPGHEGVGIVVALGAGTGIAEGGRVSLAGLACGSCEWSLGMGELCPNQRNGTPTALCPFS